MIVFDLACGAGGHRFEGWFGSSADFAEQCARGLVACPVCGSRAVAKAVMAPNLGRKGNQAVPTKAALRVKADDAPVAGGEVTGEARAALTALAALQAEALKRSRWVGQGFADTSRAMHYGEQDAAPIHGQASADEARALIEEGITVMPLLFPLAPPDDLN